MSLDTPSRWLGYVDQQQASESGRHIGNMWDKVEDFRWLKSEQSPNWSTIPQNERVAEDVWRSKVPGGPDDGLKEILSEVGIQGLESLADA